jgi:RNase P/RNase MRP subunit p30
MIDIVFPKDNEKEFISMAERLGLEGLVFVYSAPKDISHFQKGTKLKLSSGILCKPEDVRKYKGKFLTLVESPEDQERIRHIIEQVRPDMIFNLEFSRRKDFIHHRASGLNHVLAQLAVDKGVAIGFNFSALLASSPRERAVVMGRMVQNAMFAKKFRFRTALASFAGSPWQMRASHDIFSFFLSAGMDADGVKRYLGWRNDG